MDDRYREGRPLLDYDSTAPLEIDLDERPLLDNDAYAMYQLTYASPMGGAVPAFLLIPSADGPHPAVLMMHGLRDNKSAELPFAQRFATSGAVVLVIDAPFAREGRRSEPPISFTERDREEHIQLIVDLRRAVDLLLAREDVDPQRIAYHGFSYGGMAGGLLAGVEDRLAAYALIVADGGLVEHYTGPDDNDGPLQQLAPVDRDRWVALMEPLESLYFVGHAAPAQLLLQSARRDELVPATDAERFHAAASEPRTVIWYDSGHALPPKAECDVVAWLGERIGIDPARYNSSCG
ncbi:MAG: alpha/beta hydrolase [Candidatus Limnocylindria bacterium]